VSQGDDVVFLPSIVEAAVASPVAAAECARLTRKFMSKDYWTKPSCQYNAIMLVRILVDNPGPGFTRYMDKKFVDTTKELLRTGRDASVRQILMETLDSFENTRASDEGLALIIEMWKKEKEKAYKAYGVSVIRSVNMQGHAANRYANLMRRQYRRSPVPGEWSRRPLTLVTSISSRSTSTRSITASVFRTRSSWRTG
jgi:hypothetical protein